MSQTILKNDADLQTLLSKYVRKEHFTDVTLVSEDLQTFKAYKLILSAYSRVMERLFLMESLWKNEMTVLHLRGYKGILIQKMLRYMYFGEVNVETEEETNFNILVTELDIVGLEVTRKVDDVLKLHPDILCLKTKYSILNENKISLNVLEETEHAKIADELEDNKKTNKRDSVIKKTQDKENIAYSDNQETSQGRRPTKGKYYKVIEGVESIFECVFCSELYPKKKLLNRHTTNYHYDAKQYQCKKCLKTYDRLDRLEYHFHTFHRPHVFQCIECDLTSGSKRVVHEHYQLKHNSSLQFPCNQCSYIAKRRKDLKYHISAVHEDTQKRFKCDDCGVFVKNLRAHKKLKHERIKYPCSRCPFQASSKNYLKRHEDGLHDGIKTKCNQCEFLGTQFTVKKHIETVHDGVRHRCDQCTMVYRSGNQLKIHQIKKHGINHIKRDYQRDYELFRNPSQT